jgi:hypothetical protein
MNAETPAAPSPFVEGTQLQFAWDSTSLGYLKECPRKYFYTIVEGWRGKGQSVHLEFGGLYHKALEEYDKLRAREESTRRSPRCRRQPRSLGLLSLGPSTTTRRLVSISSARSSGISTSSRTMPPRPFVSRTGRRLSSFRFASNSNARPRPSSRTSFAATSTASWSSRAAST